MALEVSIKEEISCFGGQKFLINGTRLSSKCTYSPESNIVVIDVVICHCDVRPLCFYLFHCEFLFFRVNFHIVECCQQWKKCIQAESSSCQVN